MRCVLGSDWRLEMGELKHVVPTGKLRTGLVEQVGRQLPLYVSYERPADVFWVRFVTPQHQVVVHHLQGQISLLYLPGCYEVVGVCVENFVLGFLPGHSEARRLWALSAPLLARSEGYSRLQKDGVTAPLVAQLLAEVRLSGRTSLASLASVI